MQNIGSSKRQSTLTRHNIVKQKVNQYLKIQHKGIPLNYEKIVEKVGEELGYSKRYVEVILKE